MYDVIIIGAGPAGISASIYTKRAGLKTLVIHNDNSTLKKVKKIENYYGFENGISGSKLYENGINQAKNLGVEFVNDEVVDIQFLKEFNVISLKKEYISKSVILATGSKKNVPNIKGVNEYDGKGISYCAICDAFFYRNKDVSVIGNGNYAISELTHLLNVANTVTLLTNGKEAPMLRADNLDIINKRIDSINGQNRVENIKFEDNTILNTDGVFIAEGVASSVDLARKIGAITNGTNIIVDENMKTSIDGLYACGDTTGGLLQISKAVYEGAKAGVEVIKKLKNM